LKPIPAGPAIFIGVAEDAIPKAAVLPGQTFEPCHNCGGGVSVTPESRKVMEKATRAFVFVCHRCHERYVAGGLEPLVILPFSPGQVAEGGDINDRLSRLN